MKIYSKKGMSKNKAAPIPSATAPSKAAAKRIAAKGGQTGRYKD